MYRLEAQVRDQALHRLLLEAPDAQIRAMAEDASGIPLPESLRRYGLQEFTGSVLDRVRPGDVTAVIEMWQRMREHGATYGRVGLQDDDDNVGLLHYIDVREAHGVIACVLQLQPGPEPVKGVVPPGDQPTARVARLRKDVHAVVVDADESAMRLLGFTREELVGRRALEFTHPDDHDGALEGWMTMLATPGLARQRRMRHQRAEPATAGSRSPTTTRSVTPRTGVC